MTLTSSQLREVIEGDLSVLIGMTSAANLKKKNTDNSFTADDAAAILRAVDAYADARVREQVALEQARVARAARAQGSRRLRRTA